MHMKMLVCWFVLILGVGSAAVAEPMTPEQAVGALDSEFWSQRREAVKRLKDASPGELAPLTSRLVGRMQKSNAEDWELAAILEKAPSNPKQAAKIKQLLEKAVDEGDSLRFGPLSRAWAALADPNRQAYHRLVLERMVEAVREEDEEALAEARAALDVAPDKAEADLLERLPEVDEPMRRRMLVAIGELAGSPGEGVKRLKAMETRHPEWAAELDHALWKVKEENILPSIRLTEPLRVVEGRSVTFEVQVDDPDNVVSLLDVRVATPPERGTLKKLDTRAFAYSASPGTEGKVDFTLEVADTMRTGVLTETFSVRVLPDREPPQVISAKRHLRLHPNRVEVMFSEPVAEDAAQPSNWKIEEARITAVNLAGDGRSASIQTEGLPAEGEVSLSVHRLRDLAATPNISENMRVSVKGVTWKPGIRYRYWEGGRSVQKAPETEDPKTEGVAKRFVLDVAERDREFALVFEGRLRIEQPGEYTFYTTSDDGSHLFVDGEEVVDNGGYHGMETESGTWELPVGVHPVRLHFYQGGGGKGLKVEWSGPDFDRQSLPAQVLFH